MDKADKKVSISEAHIKLMEMEVEAKEPHMYEVINKLNEEFATLESDSAKAIEELTLENNRLRDENRRYYDWKMIVHNLGWDILHNHVGQPGAEQDLSDWIETIEVTLPDLTGLKKQALLLTDHIGRPYINQGTPHGTHPLYHTREDIEEDIENNEFDWKGSNDKPSVDDVIERLHEIPKIWSESGEHEYCCENGESPYDVWRAYMDTTYG
jgi:FtsZ-binding cell division protein ZapB